jgi:hypothetical protein
MFSEPGREKERKRPPANVKCGVVWGQQQKLNRSAVDYRATMRQGIHKKLLLMRAAACLLAVLILVAADFVVAPKKHLIDPMHPGSLNPEPLPPLQNPDAPSTPAKELFARKSSPFPRLPRSIGGHSNGCLAGAVPLPITGPTWQVMRPSRNPAGAIRNSFASSSG